MGIAQLRNPVRNPTSSTCQLSPSDPNNGVHHASTVPLKFLTPMRLLKSTQIIDLHVSRLSRRIVNLEKNVKAMEERKGCYDRNERKAGEYSIDPGPSTRMKEESRKVVFEEMMKQYLQDGADNDMNDKTKQAIDKSVDAIMDQIRNLRF